VGAHRPEDIATNPPGHARTYPARPRPGTFSEGMRPRFAVLFFALTFSAHSQAREGQLGAGHDRWHQSFYNALQRPDGKGSCCNLTDCRPTSGRTVDDHYEVKVNGAWISVPPTKIIHRSAPDGGLVPTNCTA
jgi:hypothetical protein